MRLVRKIDKNIPVYIVTAFQNDYLEELKSIRDDGIEFQILTKPIEKDHLLQVLDGVILQKLSESDSVVKLRLYVATKTKRINKAINNLHEFFQKELAGKYSLEVISAIDEPILAGQDNILATPTLLKVSPEPTQRIIGDLRSPETVLHKLGLAKTL